MVMKAVRVPGTTAVVRTWTKKSATERSGRIRTEIMSSSSNSRTVLLLLLEIEVVAVAVVVVVVALGGWHTPTASVIAFLSAPILSVIPMPAPESSAVRNFPLVAPGCALMLGLVVSGLLIM